jgi:hypothetical protein
MVFTPMMDGKKILNKDLGTMKKKPKKNRFNFADFNLGTYDHFLGEVYTQIIHGIT